MDLLGHTIGLGDHPAAMLFGSPVAGGGVGIDNLAFLSWFQYGGGKQLYDQLWKEWEETLKDLCFNLLVLKL